MLLAHWLRERKSRFVGNQRSLRRGRRGRRPAQAGFLLVVEPLENRLLLTTPLSFELNELHAEDFAREDRFGEVAFADNIAVIGSKDHDDNGHDSGSAYVFRRDENDPADLSDDSWKQVIELTPTELVSSDSFGSSVAIFGDDVSGYTIAVGAVGDDSGTVYVFTSTDNGSSTDPTYDEWILQDKLTAGDGVKGDRFADDRALSISGDTIVVGASQHSDMGAAYVFENDGGTWSQSAKLTADDANRRDLFGSSVSISGATILVGAVGARAAYVFELDENNTPTDPTDDSWPQKAELTHADGNKLGFDVAISETEDTIVASALGSTIVFERPAGTSWGDTEGVRLTPWDAPEPDAFRFGWSVDVHRDGINSTRDTIVVGAISHPDGGAAYVFENSTGTWQPHVRLMSDDDAEGTLGASVATDGTIVLAGDKQDDAEGEPDGPVENAGSVYVFLRDPPPPTPSIAITPTSPAETTEGGGTATFEVTLTTAPLSGKTVTITVDSVDSTEGSAASSPLIFDESNWDTAQVVTVTGQDDTEPDGDIAYDVELVASSGDPAYNGLANVVSVLDVAVLPRAALGDKQCLHVGSLEPAANRLRHELRPVIAANVLWRATNGEKISQHANHILGGERTSHFNRQAFTRVLVDHHQKSQLTTVFGSIGNEVVRPDMVLVACLVSDAAVLAATEVQTSPAMLFPRDLHVLSLPKAVDSLVIYTPITFDE